MPPISTPTQHQNRLIDPARVFVLLVLSLGSLALFYHSRGEIPENADFGKTLTSVADNLGLNKILPCTDASPSCDVEGHTKGFVIPKEVQQLGVIPSADAARMISNTNNWQGAAFPLENFQGYTSGFGYRQSPSNASGWELHRGLDLAAPEGSYIRNWWAGKVVQVADDPLCGIMLRIQSGEWQHVYCHMQGKVETASNGRYLIDRSGGILIWEGQQIPGGARIGRVGMTGRTTGPHLHWGLKYANNYIDPALVLRAMYGQQMVRGQ